jgi:hypothetical protein
MADTFVDAGIAQIQLIVNVYMVEVPASTTNVSLVLNIAPYDAVLVPLQQAMVQVLQNRIHTIVDEYTDPDRFLKTLLNFGDDTQKILTNWRYDPNNPSKLLVKMLEPLDFSLTQGQNVFISREVANTIIDTVKFELLPIPDTTPYLRPLNSDIAVINQVNSLRNKNLQTIGIDTQGVSDNYGNYSFANDILRRWYTDDYRSAELNVDFTDYANFVSYGSAELRLAAFRQKLVRIQDLEKSSRFIAGIATSSIFGIAENIISEPTYITTPTQSYASPLIILPPSGSLTAATGSTILIISPEESPSASVFMQEGSQKAALEIEQIIRSFDGYERYLFYTTGSAYSASAYWVDNNTEYNVDGTWPKRINGTLYAPTEQTAIDWYNIQSSIAVRYDENNHNVLSNAIPSYLQSDVLSVEFIKFVKLIGHFFDDVKLYIQNMTSMYDRNTIATQGMSQDLVWYIAQSFGIKLTNPNSATVLYDYIADGSLTKRRELTSEFFKRYLHNSLYLNRIKGSRESLRALLNIYGLNEQIVGIRESDTPTTGSFEIFDENTYALAFNSGSYLALPAAAANSTYRPVRTAQVRFSLPPKVQPTTLVTGDNYWHMQIMPHPSSSSTLGRIEVTNDIGEILLSSSYAEFYDDIYYDVMLRWNTEDVNLQVAQSDGEEILFSSSMYTTGSYLIDALPLTQYINLGGSGSLSLNNFEGSVDEVRLWGEEITDSVFKSQVLNPGSYAGNYYDSAAESLYVRLSFHKPANLNLYSALNESPYKNKDGISDPTTPLLPNITYIIPHGFRALPDFPYQAERITRRVYQYTTNGGSAAYGSNKIIIAPPAVFTEVTPLGEPILHRDRSIVSIDARKKQPQSKRFVGFFVSPTDAVNNIIIRSLGNVDVNSLVGYPGNRFEKSYTKLEAYKNYYNKYYGVSVNIPEFVKFFDQLVPTLFDQARQLLPAKTTLSTGIVIEPNILERKKLIFDETVQTGGANTRAILGTDPNFILSTETTVSIKDDYISSSALYNNYDTTINIATGSVQPKGTIDINYDAIFSAVSASVRGLLNNYDTTISMQSESVSAEQLTYNATAISSSVLMPYATYVTYEAQTNLINTESISAENDTYSVTIPSSVVSGSDALNTYYFNSTIIPVIKPRTDFDDYGVINYFNQIAGIYTFERVQKTIIGAKQYNFLTGSAATWSFGTVYNKNDVVMQLNSTGSATNGDGKYYRFVAQGAPAKSYNYPSLDRNSWVPIYYNGQAIEKPYRVVFDVNKNVNNAAALETLPLTIVDLSRPITQPGRFTKKLSLGAILGNARVTGVVNLDKISTLFEVQSSQDNIRIRLYDNSDRQAADIARPIGVEPTGSHGVLFDMVIGANSTGILPLYPPVTLINNDDVVKAAMYYTVDNLSITNTLGIVLNFNYFALDTQPITPLGYLPRHYKFYRDNLLSTKRRNYLGCLQTQDTTTDGRPPVEVNLTAGTAITVSPNILTSDENLGGTNLNV